MKILILGPLGAGKSSLAYAVNKKFSLPRLNLDEACRCPVDGSYYPQEKQLATPNGWLKVASGIFMKKCALMLLLICG